MPPSPERPSPEPPSRDRPSRRILSVWLPRLATDRLLLARGGGPPILSGAAGRPLVVTAPVAGRPVVAVADAAAAAGGVAAGMPLGDARALLPRLRAVEADPAGALRDLERLADWCGRYSPIVAMDGVDGLLVDTSGCDHLFGGEAAMVRDLGRRIAALGFAVRTALADTPGAAWAVARHGGRDAAVVPAGGARDALAPLPVEALRLARQTVERMGQVGLRRVADLYTLPRAPLVRRFGAEVARRLDLALGAQFEPVSPRLPVPPWRLRMTFPEPLVRSEDIVSVAQRLVHALCGRLERERLGVRDLTLAFYRVDGLVVHAAIGTGRASRDPGHLLQLLREPLAGLDLGSVPGHEAEAAILFALRVEPLSARQLGLPGKVSGAPAAEGIPSGSPSGSLSGSPSEPAGMEGLAELIDRLTHRLGPRAVSRPVLRESHLPERAVVRMPPLAPPPAPGTGLHPEWPRTRIPPLRPLRLLAPPEPIEAVSLLPDAPPAVFYWRRIPHRVSHADGPERIAPEWWLAPEEGEDEAADPDDATRDYYRLEVEDGRRFWVFRRGLYRPARPQPEPAWFLHGLFA